LKKRALLSWSSGKDSAWALHVLRAQGEFDIVGLVTTVNETHDRVAMHAVRRALLEAQARAVGLPVRIVPIPYPCSNAQYEAAMAELVARATAEGIECMAFGDLFLEDVRAYREARLAGTGLEPVFPLWGRSTRSLAEEMVQAGLVAHLTCVDPKKLPVSFAGRKFDGELLRELPQDVDPCGENGEFHSFVSAGPMLATPVPIRVGIVVERDGFVFCDLELAVAGTEAAGGGAP
jgi:uncharacterized protein (TIGR00290 family)